MRHHAVLFFPKEQNANFRPGTTLGLASLALKNGTLFRQFETAKKELNGKSDSSDGEQHGVCPEEGRLLWGTAVPKVSFGSEIERTR